MHLPQHLAFAGASLAALLLSASALSAKTFVYCSEGSPENFTPAINVTGTSFDAARPVFSKLVRFDRGTTNVMPDLAENWDVSEDGKTLTFHLRKGVKWHSEARKAMRALLTVAPNTTISHFRKYMSYRDAEFVERYLRGLREAGLPE